MTARILVSRNKREGGYCGRIRGYWTVLNHCKGSKHRRAGSREYRRCTLREWSRA